MSNGSEPTIEDTIEKLAIRGVESSSEGDKSMTMMSVDDLKKARDITSAKKAAAKPHFGLRFTKNVPPGTG